MHLWLQDLAALLQVLVIDFVLAGDNALVVGLVVARLPEGERPKVLFFGIAAAAAIRLLLALITVQLLRIIGLTLAGGILLLWVCWKTNREFTGHHGDTEAAPASSFGAAILRIAAADLSMSLDNVLAVAGASVGRPWVMAGGLILSVLLTGTVAAVVAKLLDRFRFLVWGGIALILWVALRMIWLGAHQVIVAVF